MSFWFLLLCIIAAILIGLSAALRGVSADTPFATKFTLSVTFLTFSTITLIVYRIRGGDKFVWPWYRVVKFSENEDAPNGYIFSKTQLFMLMLGGCCEFLISLFVILCFSASLKANINQGIGTSILTLNAVIVSIMSYWIFKEKITLMNGIGIVIIIVALVLIGIFGPEKDTMIDVLHPEFGYDAG